MWSRGLDRVRIYNHQLEFVVPARLNSIVSLAEHFLPMFVETVHLLSARVRTSAKRFRHNIRAEIHSAHES
jgi:hypothetical protein